WYHVKLKVEGCQIDASLSAAGMRELKTTPVNDPDCFRAGLVGFRSNNTGGVWRNVSVSPLHSKTVAAAPLPADGPQAIGRSAAGASSVPPQTINSLFYAAPFGAPQV